MIDYICEQLSQMFDEPCNFSRATHDVDDFMSKHCASYCKENCANHNGAKCWRKYFEALFDTDMRGEE